MALELTVSSQGCCYRGCNDATMDNIIRMRERFNIASGSVQDHLRAVGKVLEGSRAEYDFELTIQVIREQTAKLEAIEKEAIQAMQKLGTEPVSCCKIASDKMVRGLSYVVEPLTWLTGLTTIGVELLKDASNQNPKVQVAGIVLCIGGFLVSKAKDRIWVKLDAHKNNKRELERIQDSSAKIFADAHIMANLFERLDTYRKSGERAKAREWRRLLYASQYIPKDYQTLVDPTKLKQFIKGLSPKTRQRHLAVMAGQQVQEDQKAVAPAPPRPEVVLNVEDAAPIWHE